MKGRFPRLQLLWVDGGYAGKLVDYVALVFFWIFQIAKRSDDQKGFKSDQVSWDNCIVIDSAFFSIIIDNVKREFT